MNFPAQQVFKERMVGHVARAMRRFNRYMGKEGMTGPRIFSKGGEEEDKEEGEEEEQGEEEKLKTDNPIISKKPGQTEEGREGTG